MKKLNILLSSILFGCFSEGYANYPSMPQMLPYSGINTTPRVTVTGLVGADPLARGDVLVPFVQGANSLFFGDVQGEYGEFQAWYAGAGVGYRKIIDSSKILGSYVFIDTNESRNQHNFNILSPGVELISNRWDMRLNGYVPLGSKTKNGTPFLPVAINNCGINNGNEFVEFHGHQQFERQFVDQEQVGPGLDGEIGFTFPRANNFQVHAGGYYFHLEDLNDIKGVEARIGLPVSQQVMFTAETSYDNQQRGRVVAGLQFTIGGPRRVDPRSITAHLEDPIMRNLGTVGRGNGIPILSKRKMNGLVLTKDNIFFFSPSGTATFTGANSGTVENPLAADQFSQATVDNIFLTTGDGNFYFATGTYTIQGPAAPNEIITLHNDQGLFGRSANFQFSAVGNERPTLLGGLVFEGNNTLDSIQLIDTFVHTAGNARVVTLDMSDAVNNHVCNSVIQGTSVFNGDLTDGYNIAIAIHANNSELNIQTSTVSANAIVNGAVSHSLNAAAGIGAIGGLAGTATGGDGSIGFPDGITGGAGQDGNGSQGSDGPPQFDVSSSGRGFNGISSNAADTFNLNIFTIFETAVTGIANVSGTLSAFGLNTAVGIGSIGGIAGKGGAGGSAGSSLGSSTTGGKGGNGSMSGGVGGNGGEGFNLISIGDGGTGGDANATGDFDHNIFDIEASSVSATANIAAEISNFSASFAAALGCIGGLGNEGGAGAVSGDISAHVTSGNGGSGTSSGRGGDGGVANFIITEGVGGFGGNAEAIGTFSDNNFTILHSSFLASASSLDVINVALNSAVGMGAIGGIGGEGGNGAEGSSITLTGSSGNGGDGTAGVGGLGGDASASVTGANGGDGGNGSAIASFFSNIFAITSTDITASANVIQSVSFGANFAMDIGAIGGKAGIGGNGAASGDIRATATTGNGGIGTGGGTGGMGGPLDFGTTSGSGGKGGDASATATFENTFNMVTSSLAVNASAGSLTDSFNFAIAMGSIAGLAGEGGNSGNGPTLNLSITGGNGGDGITGTGGNAGDGTLTVTSQSSGDGGDASSLGIFNLNFIAFSQGSITAATSTTVTSGESINSAITVGSIGGAGGIGGNEGNEPTVTLTDNNGANGAGPNGGNGNSPNLNVAVGNAGNGGNASAEGQFEDNTLNFISDALFANPIITTNLTGGSVNISTIFGGFGGIAGINGTGPNGGIAAATATINGNTVNWNSVSSQSTPTVIGNVTDSTNEAIGIGTDAILTSSSTFENNMVNVTNSNTSVFALIEGNNDATSLNKALGLFAGNGTTINYFTSGLFVDAVVQGVNSGTNSIVSTAVAGTGHINF